MKIFEDRANPVLMPAVHGDRGEYMWVSSINFLDTEINVWHSHERALAFRAP